MDDSIDTMGLEKLDFLQRIPVGIYRFSILEPSESGEPKPRNYTVLVYSDTEAIYDAFVSDLEAIINAVNLEDREVLTRQELEYLLQVVKDNYFLNHEFLIGYQDQDLENILRFYAQKQIKPEFIPFTERKNCNLSTVAKHIYDNSLGGIAKTQYLESLWNAEKTFWQVIFGDKLYFKKQLDIEIYKLEGDYGNLDTSPPVVIFDEVPLENLTLDQIREIDLEKCRSLVNAVYERATDPWDFITCAVTGYKSKARVNFQIDHIKPMSEGGLTTLDNLQVLSRKAHTEKTQKENLNRKGLPDKGFSEAIQQELEEIKALLRSFDLDFKSKDLLAECVGDILYNDDGSMLKNPNIQALKTLKKLITESNKNNQQLINTLSTFNINNIN
jgi:hypothetical protein